MLTRYLVPVLALCGLGLGTIVVARGKKSPEPSRPMVEPVSAPYLSCICGSGMIEACSENVRVGAPCTGIVEKIFVDTGQAVTQGSPLFRLDTRALLAQIDLQRAELQVARSKLVESQAAAQEVQAQLTLAERISDSRAISREELDRRRHAVITAQAHTQTAEAELARMRAKLHLLEVQLDQLTVCAPIDGVILQKSIHLGETVLIGEEGSKLMLLGVANPMRVRVDIDETDAWRFNPGQSAWGVLRGNPAIRIPLTFITYEPYVVPKRSLTGQARERVDTRVLQALYRFDPTDYPVYIGGQMDVYIQASPS